MEQTKEERERDLRFMRSPNQWPHWPRLPLKRVDKDRLVRHGVAIEGADGTIIVFGDKNLFAPFSPGETGLMLTPEAAYEAGWRVD